jgi:hypothetical protein
MASSKFLESLTEVTYYESPHVEATTLNPIPQNIPNRLPDLLSHLLKLNVVDSIYPSLETFTLFPNLPIELRLKIWNYSSRQSRTLLLSETWYLDQKDFKGLEIGSIENNNKVPAVLHTCSEARQEGLKNYTACAKRCSHNIYNIQIPDYTCEKQGCVGKHVYVNFDADRFLCRNYFGVGILLNELQLDKKDLVMIQFLDIECDHSWLSHFRGLNQIRLKELNLVVKEHAWGGPLLPNTIDRELRTKEYEKQWLEDIEYKRQISWTKPSDGEDEEIEGRIGWQLPDRVELACKWSWMAEEYDLVPISVGASAGYVAAGGVLENASDMW